MLFQSLIKHWYNIEVWHQILAQSMKMACSPNTKVGETKICTVKTIIQTCFQRANVKPLDLKDEIFVDEK